MWSQIVVTPSKKTFHTHGTWFGKHDWVEESKVQMEKALKPYTSTRASADDPTHYGTEVRTPGFLKPAEEGIVNKTSKLGFDTGIRICYVAKKEAFNINNRRAIRLIWRQYENPQLNRFKRINSTQGDAFSGSFFQSFFNISEEKVRVLSGRMLEEYRERAFFHLPLRHSIHFPWPISPFIFPNFFHHHTFVLNTEEIATIFHFPGQILKVPTLERIESKEAAPPSNLPV